MMFAYETNARERVQRRIEQREKQQMAQKVEKAVSIKKTTLNTLSILAEFSIVAFGFAICWFFACI